MAVISHCYSLMMYFNISNLTVCLIHIIKIVTFSCRIIYINIKIIYLEKFLNNVSSISETVAF